MLVGKPSSLPRQMARAAGAEMGLLEYGVVPYERIPDYLGCADVFLLPFADKQANIGRWPNKAGDYMAMGRPIVTSPVGEMRELFSGEAFGRLAPPDPEGFAEAVARLLQDPEACARMGRAARQAAEADYSWEFLAARLEAFYARRLEGN